MTETRYEHLAALLRRRRSVIADHAFRDRDAAAHLNALREVSEAISAEHQKLRGTLPPMLEHCLERCSFDKALAFVENGHTGH